MASNPSYRTAAPLSGLIAVLLMSACGQSGPTRKLKVQELIRADADASAVARVLRGGRVASPLWKGGRFILSEGFHVTRDPFHLVALRTIDDRLASQRVPWPARPFMLFLDNVPVIRTAIEPTSSLFDYVVLLGVESELLFYDPVNDWAVRLTAVAPW